MDQLFLFKNYFVSSEFKQLEILNKTLIQQRVFLLMVEEKNSCFLVEAVKKFRNFLQTGYCFFLGFAKFHLLLKQKKMSSQQVVSRILYFILFDSFSYSGDCYQQKPFFFFQTSSLFKKKGSCGDFYFYFGITWCRIDSKCFLHPTV